MERKNSHPYIFDKLEIKTMSILQRIHILHTWDKWQDLETHKYIELTSDDKTHIAEYIERGRTMVQRRYCKDCGKQQMRTFHLTV